MVAKYLRSYPDMNVELVIESRPIDIVAEGFDAGVRLAESVPQDMIAVPCGPDTRFVVVGAPAYLDHAPAGFFSVTPDGKIVYMNATLAGWLDQDLTRIGPGALSLRDILAGDGAALIEATAPKPGATSTETGMTTLLFERRGDAWKIVADHSS